MHHHFFHRCRRGADKFADAVLMAREQGGRGFGAFGGFMGGGLGGMGGAGFRFGRKLGSGDLQVVLLKLLAEQPSHGYELIKALEERSGGFYTPSPGMIYPALTWLEEVGYSSVAADGAKKLYTITPEGLDYLQKNQSSADAVLSGLERIGRKMGRVREIFSGDDEGDDERAGGSKDLWQARHELKRALREKRYATAEEATRIASILLRAASDIRGGK